MKQKFLTFPAQRVSYAPKIASRRMPGAIRGAAYKSDGGDGGDEKAQLLTEIQNKVRTELESRGYQSKEDVQTILNETFSGIELEALRKYKTDNQELKTTVQTMAEKLDKLEKRAGGGKENRQSIADQIRTQIAKNKEKWEQFKRREVLNFEFEVRAPVTMTIAASTGGSAYIPVPEVDMTVIQPARRRPFWESISNTGSTNRPAIVIVQKVNPEGEAAFIGEGEVKPLIDFNLATTRIDAKKVADKIKVSTEMLDDIDFMAAEIENELKYQIDIKTDTALLTGDGVGDNISGLDTFAGGYVLTTIETDDPNNGDAIRAAIAQVRSLNFVANIAVLNPIDAANMELEKATDGHYIIPPFKSADGTMISGVRVIEDNGIPVGSLLVGDMTRFRVRIYKSFTVAYGWVNDDFEKNLVTVIGEQRLMSWVASNETGAFVYDTFANIKAAIDAAP